VLRAILNRLLGGRGERAAEKFLKKAGLRIITRGYRSPFGEIDLVAREGETWVFVEVKTRRRGTPVDAVTVEKQRRLTLTGVHFLKQNGILESSARFDVVAIVWSEDSNKPVIEHIPNAFESVGHGQMFY
jgi:putative endonuclease